MSTQLLNLNNTSLLFEDIVEDAFAIFMQAKCSLKVYCDDLLCSFISKLEVKVFGIRLATFDFEQIVSKMISKFYHKDGQRS